MSSANGRLEERSIPEIVDLVWDTIGHPVRSAALFYSLYYLVEIEGFEPAAFDFKQLRERLSEGFYWYGILAITGEIGNLSSAYTLEGRHVGVILDGLVELDPEDLREHVRQQVGEEAVEVFEVAPELTTDGSRATNDQVLQAAEARFGAVSDPEDYINLVHNVFRQTPSGDETPGLRTGWSSGYNGPAWVAICEHLLRRDELSDTAWVDQSWSIEHNNSGWIDKTDFAGDDGDQNFAIVEQLDLTRFDDPRAQAPRSSEVVHAVQRILDDAQEGDAEQLLEWLGYFGGDVGFNYLEARRAVDY